MREIKADQITELVEKLCIEANCVITDDIPGIATATLGLWVQVGARSEPAELNGISHFLEHMAFKGTTTRSAKQIAEEIENVGD